MKFLRFAIIDANKAADIAQASDKVWANPPAGTKILASYVCQGIAFAGVPPQSLVAIQVIEADSNEAIAATQYPLALAGAATWDVPVLEMPVKGAAQTEKKYRR